MCVAHGGRAPAVKKKAAETYARDQALIKARKLGGSLDVDPRDALLDAVREAAANVEALREYVSRLDMDVGGVGEVMLPDSRHPLVAFYNDERDRLAKYAKLAVDAGVAERQVRVAEQQAQRLGQAFARALDAVDLPTGLRDQVRRALAVELRRLT